MSTDPIPRTPLDAWLGRKLDLDPGQPLSPDALAAWQLERLRATVAWVRERSPFHRDRLAGLPQGFPARLEDMAALPFTTADDLRSSHLAMLCVSQGQVARVVTLRTSGTTAAPKRVYFADADLELTLDFFHHGMSTMVAPGDAVLIGLPGSTPDSVGDLLARGLARMGVRGVKHGPVSDLEAALNAAVAERASCVVGIPVQVLALAEHPQGESLRGRIKSVLLTTDYVPQSLAARVRRAWGCQVFEHYGMTETGLGAGVDCAAHAGYHLRAADLYYEVVDQVSGEALLPGQEGELVLTTLTREAMPLVRYRTGDRARLLPGDCACGGVTPRLARVPGRLANRLDLGQGQSVGMDLLDEALFGVEGLLDFRAAMRAEGSTKRLELTVRASRDLAASLVDEAEQALLAVPGLGPRLAAGEIVLAQPRLAAEAWTSDGTTKRTLA